MRNIKLLLVNPPIYDYTAYDFWLKPVGLLYIGGILERENFSVRLFDFMDRFHPLFGEKRSDAYGRGKYKREIVKNPLPIKRYFKRYGVPIHAYRRILKEWKPDIVFLTTTMTYWYYGAREVLEETKRYNIECNIGGIYPSLLPEHAKSIGFDVVFHKRDLSDFSSYMGIKIPDFKFFPHLPYHFYKTLPYAVILTSIGCPFSCPYCATKKLFPERKEREVEDVVDEIENLWKKGVKNFAFYDDALLYPPGRAKTLLSEILKRKIEARFHTPNGLHVRFIDKEMATLLKKVNFVEPRLSFEGLDREKMGSKLTSGEFENAVNNLRKAGYREGEIRAYILVGLPGEGDVKESIEYVIKMGVKVNLAEFSPLPGTPYELKEDPLWHNKTAYPYLLGREREIEGYKAMVKNLNREVKYAFSFNNSSPGEYV